MSLLFSPPPPRAEKAALLSPDDEVQKSDISSSSQGLMEKEALGPMLLEVKQYIGNPGLCA